MRRTLKDRDSPLYQDTHRGRGGISGGLFTNNGTEGLEYIFTDITTEMGESLLTESSEVLIHE